MSSGAGPSLDAMLAKLAYAQHGVVAVWQLYQLNSSYAQVRRRIEAGRLVVVHRGVYAVGHARLTREGRRMAAVLAYGQGAVLSCRSAVAHWRLRPASSGPVDVTVVGCLRRSRPGIRVHCVAHLGPRDRVVLDGVPVTSLARTVLDYAAHAPFQQLRLALDAADRQDLLDHAEINDLLIRTPGHHGQKALRRALAEMRGPAPWTQSELERRFLALVRGARLPEPSANVMVGGYPVDYYWPDADLVIELDGYEYHKDRVRFEADRRMDTKLQLAGHAVVRLTQPRVRDEPIQVVEDLTRMRARRLRPRQRRRAA